MADEVRIRLLGGFAVAVEDRPVAAGAWRLRKARSLLKLLCLAPGHRIHREQVYDLLWPGLDRSAASNNLHQVLYAVRRALAATGAPGEVVVLRDDMVVLGPEGGVRVDLDAFDEASRRASDGGGTAAYRAALDLAGPGLLPEDRYEAWAGEAAEALERRRAALLLGLAEALEQDHDTAGALDVLRTLVAGDPLHEPGHRALMRVLAEAGRRREALAVYESLRDALRRDTGADPDPQTRGLYRALLADSVEPPKEPAPLRHRLPAPATALIGREREMAEIVRSLGCGRLLTLTGAGGCGKTRLALAVAARRGGDFRDGACFVDLAGLAEPDLVPEAVATALGLPLPPSGGSRQALVAQLTGRELLLVLDNCEHLVDACAALASQVIARCPGVVVLATSREPLRSYGERTFRVPSLGLPDPHRLPSVAELGRFASVRLFTERAAQADPGFRLTDRNATAVAQICFRLDGMPLALELAAARVHVLAPRQIAERLDDALVLLGRGDRRGVTRQETLLATLEWSHRLLDEEEQRLFRRLAVFVGGFSLAAAEQVCADGADEGAVLDVLDRLADKSLVSVEPRQDEVRYRLLETIRQYAAGRLRAAGEAAATEVRHRRFYLALAESWDREPPAGVPAATSLELEADHGNLRAALRSLLRDEPDGALRLAVALRSFWAERGLLAEGRRWLEDALAAAPDPSPQRARALMGRAVLAIRLGDGAPLEEIAEQIVAVHRGRPDPAALASAHCQRAILLWMRGSWERARTALDVARALALEAGEPSVLAAAAHLAGVWAVCRGEGAAAREAAGESLRLLEDVKTGCRPFFPVITPGYTVEEAASGQVSLYFEETVLAGRAVGPSRARGHALANLAWACRLDGDTGAATTAAERGVDCFRGLGDPYGESLALNTLGNVLRGAGDPEAAGPCLDAALAIRRRLGDRREEGITLGCLGLLRLAGGETGAARTAFTRALAGFEETDDLPGTINGLLHLGLVARASGDPVRARTLLGRARELEHVAGSTSAAGWVCLMLARLQEQAGQHRAAEATAARAGELFAGLGDARGTAALRRTMPRAAGGKAAAE
ncbi:Predicted ATPase [Streptomyces sp. 1222.5]|uniref:tetratricopeptide repeat protein n=1 Tax=unclassified Streptomyces TaxID=2593676 RepID=UPI00089C0130|nr:MULTISPECIES: tetratricopeptide repeat protein [unclassified Streptomyces]PKW12004.1 putative ATPase [Streptomyces sp. 5112.2]SEB64814.1 Predicted ATPase [Streptomyces sp. 1222.5]